MAQPLSLLHHAVLALTGAIFIASCASTSREPGLVDSTGEDQGDDWPMFAADAGGSRHSAAAQITPANVDELQVAWIYRTGDYRLADRGGRFESTPLMVDATLYVSTPFGRVIALDPVTGEEVWNFDPLIDLTGDYGDWASRGVATWVDPSRDSENACRRRIFVAPVDARLIALDAVTGRPCQEFGQDGTVILTEGLRTEPAFNGEFQVTSPPAVIHDLVVVGSAIADNQRVDAPSGEVRAFDARTGSLRWSWDPIPRDASLRVQDSWLADGAGRVGAANAWAPIAVDEPRDLLIIPTGSPSPDYYGGERPGRNDYANSIVALRGSTGEVVWHFQVVHHDLWDYDVPAQPVLVTVERGGREIPAVVQATKMGHLFVLDRTTGEPLFSVEERPVPASNVPGEHSWPTQPFPTAPAPIVPQRLAADEAFGVTEEERAYCRERIKSLRWDGMYTPPGLEWTLVYPGNVGGSNWGGVAYDPQRGLLFAPANRIAAAVRLIPRVALEGARRERETAETAAQRGTPFGMQREFIISPGGTPCNAPPWGTLTAIDVVTGEQRWERPLGSMPRLADVPGSDQWGSLNLGGVMSTGAGLVFASGGFDEKLHAFSAESGRLLWSADLPAGGNASPMTYRIEGRQFVVISAGGHDEMGTKAGDYVVAFALPAAGDEVSRLPSMLPVEGRYEGQLLVGDGRYPLTLSLDEGAASDVEGELAGALIGTVAGRIEGDSVLYEVPFTLAAESCTGRLSVAAERANYGRMLVGSARLSGECSDGQEEIGVVSVRRADR